jgi:hypothetical protein
MHGVSSKPYILHFSKSNLIIKTNNKIEITKVPKNGLGHSHFSLGGVN